MTKFCGNCGAQINENSPVCVACGAPVPNMGRDGNAPEPASVTLPADVQQKKASAKVLKSIAVILAVLLVAVSAYKILYEFTGHRGVIRKFFKAYETSDVTTMLSLYDESLDLGGSGTGFEAMVGLILDGTWDVFEEEVGSDPHADYEIDETYEMSAADTAELAEEWGTEDYNFDHVDKILVAEITMTVSGTEGEKSSAVEMLLVKRSGAWKILRVDMRDVYF